MLRVLVWAQALTLPSVASGRVQVRSLPTASVVRYCRWHVVRMIRVKCKYVSAMYVCKY
jgi:hypothetical protein